MAPAQEWSNNILFSFPDQAYYLITQLWALTVMWPHTWHISALELLRLSSTRETYLLHSWDIVSYKLQQQQPVPNYLPTEFSLSLQFLCSCSLNFYFFALVSTNCTTCSSMDIDSAEYHVGGLLSLTAALPHTRNSETQVLFLYFVVVLCFNCPTSLHNALPFWLHPPTLVRLHTWFNSAGETMANQPTSTSMTLSYFHPVSYMLYALR